MDVSLIGLDDMAGHGFHSKGISVEKARHPCVRMCVVLLFVCFVLVLFCFVVLLLLLLLFSLVFTNINSTFCFQIIAVVSVPSNITSLHITKTYLYNFDHLKPRFYIVKLGFTGVQMYTLFLLFLLKNIDCGYSLEPPRRGGSNEYPQSMFWAEIWKTSDCFIWKTNFGGKIFNIFE